MWQKCFLEAVLKRRYCSSCISAYLSGRIYIVELAAAGRLSDSQVLAKKKARKSKWNATVCLLAVLCRACVPSAVDPLTTKISVRTFTTNRQSKTNCGLNSEGKFQVIQIKTKTHPSQSQT